MRIEEHIYLSVPIMTSVQLPPTMQLIDSIFGFIIPSGRLIDARVGTFLAKSFHVGSFAKEKQPFMWVIRGSTIGKQAQKQTVTDETNKKTRTRNSVCLVKIMVRRGKTNKFLRKQKPYR